MPLNKWSSPAACSVMVWTISGWPWPRRDDIWPEVKSRICLPSLVVIMWPLAPVMITGLKLPPYRIVDALAADQNLAAVTSGYMLEAGAVVGTGIAGRGEGGGGSKRGRLQCG